MAVISYHVEAHNLSTTSLLQSLYDHQQSGDHDHTDIFLSSGDQTVSVPSILLANFSPFLSSLLQSPCPCLQSNFIILPVTPSFTMHSLVALLYTGYISNMDRNQVEQLRVLTKEMGIEISMNIMTSVSSSSQSDTEEVQIVSKSRAPAAATGDYCASASIASGSQQCDSGGDRYSSSGDKYNSDSYTNTVTRVTQVRRKRIRLSDVMDIDFVQMCPPVGTGTPNQIFEEPADNIKQEGIVLHSDIKDNDSRQEILVENSLLDISEENGPNYELDSDKHPMPNRNSLSGGDELEEEIKAMAGELFYEDSVVEGHKADRVFDYENDFQDCQLENNNRLPSVIFCKICDQILEKEQDFKAHLTSTHFQTRLLEEFGNFDKSCPFCQKQSKDVGRNMKHIED